MRVPGRVEIMKRCADIRRARKVPHCEPQAGAYGPREYSVVIGRNRPPHDFLYNGKDLFWDNIIRELDA